jgi:DNA replication protein DnaC
VGEFEVAISGGIWVAIRDVAMASTILDRLMHRCVMLEFEGKSYRLKEAAARLAIQADGS